MPLRTGIGKYRKPVNGRNCKKTAAHDPGNICCKHKIHRNSPSHIAVSDNPGNEKQFFVWPSTSPSGLDGACQKTSTKNLYYAHAPVTTEFVRNSKTLTLIPESKLYTLQHCPQNLAPQTLIHEPNVSSRHLHWPAADEKNGWRRLSHWSTPSKSSHGDRSGK